MRSDNMNVGLIQKQNCCGCEACANSCPNGCIKMVEDGEGFLYPEVDEKQCIGCGRCVKVCKGNAEGLAKSSTIDAAYACICRSKEIVTESSSGGVFSVLADKILLDRGKVYGAAFDEEYSVHHIFVDNLQDLFRLRGSKYVQSKVGDCYIQVRSDLLEGKEVLFSGTPCQIDGLKSFLGKDYPNLYCIDIICHGVPSPMVWRRYLEMLERKLGAERRRESFPSFRAKPEGWERFSVSIPFSHDTEYRMFHGKDLYMQMFLDNIILRPSCYECRHKAVRASADITLADFWGIEKVDAEMYDKDGVSLVIVHSEKGQKLFENITAKLIWKKENLSDAVSFNRSYYKSYKEPCVARKKFFDNVDIENLERLMKNLVRDKKIKKCINKISLWRQ